MPKKVERVRNFSSPNLTHGYNKNYVLTMKDGIKVLFEKVTDILERVQDTFNFKFFNDQFYHQETSP